jgi:hypothetical protein
VDGTGAEGSAVSPALVGFDGVDPLAPSGTGAAGELVVFGADVAGGVAESVDAESVPAAALPVPEAAVDVVVVDVAEVPVAAAALPVPETAADVGSVVVDVAEVPVACVVVGTEAGVSANAGLADSAEIPNPRAIAAAIADRCFLVMVSLSSK